MGRIGILEFLRLAIQEKHGFDCSVAEHRQTVML